MAGPLWGRASPKSELRGGVIGDSGLTTLVQGISEVSVREWLDHHGAGHFGGQSCEEWLKRKWPPPLPLSLRPVPFPPPSLSESSTLRHVLACAFVLSEFVQTVHAAVHGTV